jgi:malate synthase
MSQIINKDKLEIDSRLHDLVVNDILPETGITEDHFWQSFQSILEEFIPRNKALLATRDDLQSQIDAWHIQHKDVDHDPAKYKQFLKDINYIVEEGDDFSISTENVDPEIKTIAGPQLVVPINNARFSLNATNARWGSLFDAVYGTDVIPNEGELAKGKSHNTKRGAEVVKFAHAFLDSALPLTEGGHGMVSAYSLIDSGTRKVLQVILNNGHIAELKNTDAFIGYTEDDASAYSLLFKNNGLHIEIQIDPCSLIGKTMLSGIKDILLESAITTIQDCEDSVTAVDAEDKVIVYQNWLGLMKGNLEQSFEKNGKTLKRQLNPDREFIALDGKAIKLSGRSLLLVRNVGHLMTIDAVKFNGQNIPEGILDGMITALAFMHDYKGNSPYKNSTSNSMYIVKPKMHGPDEVRFTVDLFGKIEEALGIPKNTMKVGIMDEERRTTVNLKECIRQAQERLIFINTGFLDRTGDEIHTSMEAGAFLPKAEMKTQPWIKAYEDWNVDIGIQCGLPGKAQIGKGMWAMPDLMADMLKDKIQHPLAGANCAWVPSPTAATLHVMHYHQVNVAHVQNELAHRVPASLDDILTIPLMVKPPLLTNPLSEDQITSELRDNTQSILGYVVRWIDHGVGCSKVPDTHNVALMEDRATLRISSQLIANWLHHDLCSVDDITSAFKEMAIVVDEQNAHDPFYNSMAPDYDGIAFQTALDLALKGREQPNGYTEPLLHAYRIKQKTKLK